jgi:predicted small integral membrane protein
VAVILALYGFYMLLVALGNLTDFDTNQEFVQRVLATDTTTFGAEPGTNRDDDVMRSAITTETLQDVVYIGIIAWESATALVLLLAGVAWLRLRGRGHEAAMSFDNRPAHGASAVLRRVHRYRR